MAHFRTAAGRGDDNVRNRFDAQLTQMNDLVAQMGRLCEDAIAKATNALQDGNIEMAQEVMRDDTQIDRAEREIEQLCLTLLLQQQPVARDLRQISAALKMITDMERIGDQASDIAEIVISAQMNETTDFPEIAAMSREASGMVSDAVKAFLTRDLELASHVERHDDVVDRMFDDVKAKLFDLISTNQTEYGHRAIDLIMIAKYLERIADHAANIAEWVIYSVTGVHESGPDSKRLT